MKYIAKNLLCSSGNSNSYCTVGKYLEYQIIFTVFYIRDVTRKEMDTIRSLVATQGTEEKRVRQYLKMCQEGWLKINAWEEKKQRKMKAQNTRKRQQDAEGKNGTRKPCMGTS